MKKLPMLDLKKIPNRVNNLPEGHYLITLVQLSTVFVKKWNMRGLIWCWEIEDEIDRTLLEGKRVISLSGNSFNFPHYYESPAQISLVRHIEAFGFECSLRLRLSTLIGKSITLDVEGDVLPTIRMMPEWYYGMVLMVKSDEWIVPYFLDR